MESEVSAVSHPLSSIVVSLLLVPIALVGLGKAFGVYGVQVQLLNPSEVVPLVVLFDGLVVSVSIVLYGSVGGARLPGRQWSQ